MSHDHHHHHSPAQRLGVAVWLTCIILAIEVVVGWRANSLALLSDAGHIVTDIFALGLAWYATRLAERPADGRNTFGYRRGGILAAFVNAAVLVVIALVILGEAGWRVAHPQTVDGKLIVPAALAAIAVNAYIMFGLSGERGHNLNVRAAWLHVLGDLAASAAVVLAGIAIALTGSSVIDPLLSAVIALLIAYGAWHILRDTVGILMESTPTRLDLQQMRAAMAEVPGVQDVHDLHVWALADGFYLLTAHVKTPEQTLSATATLLADLKLLLRRRFQIEHATIELECEDCHVSPRRPVQFLTREAGEVRPGRQTGVSR